MRLRRHSHIWTRLLHNLLLATMEKAGYSIAMTKYGSRPTQFAELNELLGQMVLQVGRILGDNFVGAYLQGSFALGDEHGVTLAGPSPKDLVDEVDPDVLRTAMREEAEEFLPGMLAWIKLDSPWAQRYAVTTLCRILYTLETGQVASKRVSLLWAKDNLDPQWQELISETLEGRSLGWNHSDPVKPGTLEATLAFHEYAKQRAAGG
jgi:hypothetical protein